MEKLLNEKANWSPQVKEEEKEKEDGMVEQAEETKSQIENYSKEEIVEVSEHQESSHKK